MARITATIGDWWRRRRQLENPAFLSRHNVKLGNPNAETATLTDRVPHLITDPVSDQAGAEFRFYNDQLIAGQDLLQSGMGPQTAADVQNIAAVQSNTLAANPIAAIPETPGPLSAGPVLPGPGLQPIAAQDPLAPPPIQDPLAPILKQAGM